MKIENFIVGNTRTEGECCPECNVLWDGGDIYIRFLRAKFDPTDEIHDSYKDKTLEEIMEIAGSYGWTIEEPIRFCSDNLIGLDLSMDPDADKEDRYDGVSYWFCKGCGVAWGRVCGERTEKFKGQYGHIEESVPEDRQIIYNAMQTPDGTIIESTHRHDYVTYTDKNGEMYMVDGGKDYLRRSVNKVKAKELSLYLEPWTPEFHEKARKVVKRGGRGKDGTESLKWVPICEMNDEWVLNTVEYNVERGMGIEKSWFTNLLHEEMNYRHNNSITIKDDD